MVALDRALTMK